VFSDQRSAVSFQRRHAEPEEGCRTMFLAESVLASAEPKQR